MPQVKHWVVGWNMVGYLPDVEHVLHGVELDEGVDYLKEELERAADSEADRDAAEKFDRARQRVDEWHLGDMRARAAIHGAEENWTCVESHIYWARACFNEACKEINTDEGPALTPVPGATPVYDDEGNEVVTVGTCGHCGRSWNDAAISAVTPTPSARCPFEYDHKEQ